MRKGLARATCAPMTDVMGLRRHAHIAEREPRAVRSPTPMTRAAVTPLLIPHDRLLIREVEHGVCTMGTWKNVGVVVWCSQATASAVRHLAQFTQTMREQPTKTSAIHIVHEGAGLPLPEAREALVKLLREKSDHLAGLAVVIGGSGFWASTMRSAITGMGMLSPRSTEMRLHGTIGEVLQWLPRAHRERTGITLESAALVQVLQEASRWSATETPL